MCRYTDVEFVLISPKELAVPDYIKTDVLDASGMKYTEVEHMEDVMPRLDVLYMTRIQRERFFSEDEYLRHKDAFVLKWGGVLELPLIRSKTAMYWTISPRVWVCVFISCWGWTRQTPRWR